MRDFKDLAAWQESHRLVLEVPTNIAEGCGRHGERELARFLSIAPLYGELSAISFQHSARSFHRKLTADG